MRIQNESPGVFSRISTVPRSSRRQCPKRISSHRATSWKSAKNGSARRRAKRSASVSCDFWRGSPRCAASNAWAKSAQVAKRSAGCLASARSSTSSTCAGSDARSRLGRVGVSLLIL